MAVAALVLGIVSLVFGTVLGWMPFISSIIGIVCGLLAVFFGIRGVKVKKGMSLTGVILGGVGVLASIMWLVVVLLIAGAGSQYEALQEVARDSSQEGGIAAALSSLDMTHSQALAKGSAFSCSDALDGMRIQGYAISIVDAYTGGDAGCAIEVCADPREFGDPRCSTAVWSVR